ncbi:MAG: MarC family protein [Candidatus Acidiferrum sp.]
MKDVFLLLRYIPFAFSALLPVINPIGSAVLFLSFVQDSDHATRKVLARRIAVNTFLFLAIVLVAGTQVLHFFGISLPIVQIAGGFVLATMGWRVLNREDTDTTAPPRSSITAANVDDKVFYPFTFPLTAGPGCIVVVLTLSAHSLKLTIAETVLAHLGMLIGMALVGLVIYLSYAYADKTASKLPAAISQGILRVMSFILVCIGAEIAWHGAENLIRSVR